MSNPAGLNRFQRVMVTKFPGKCYFCGKATEAGIDWAVTKGGGLFHAVCTTCASSVQEQVKASVVLAEELAEQSDLSEVVLPSEDEVVAAIAPEANEADALRVLFKLQNLHAHLRKNSTDPLIVGLRRVAAESKSSKDVGFASSLLQQHDRGRELSGKQKACAEPMIARFLGTNKTVVVEQEDGLYLIEEKAGSTIHKLYHTRNGFQSGKVLRVFEVEQADGTTKWQGAFDYVKGTPGKVQRAVADGTGRRLTQAEATTFGKQYSFCVNCARYLDDDRSLAVGYGPFCAENHGWWYPNHKEAAEILGTPASV